MSRAAQITIAVVLVLGFGIWIFSGQNTQTAKNNSTTTPATSTQTNTDIPTDWETYVSEEFDFTIAHPANVTIQTEGPENRYTKFTYLGPGNEEGTEITDGFTLTVSSYRKASTTAANLEGFASQQIEENPVSDVIEPPTETTFNNRPAVSYETESIGIGIEHIVTETDSTFIKISTAISDPNDIDYADIAATMKSSLMLQGN